MRLVDLHTHSSASDGSDSPAVLLDKALALNLAALALTDHDTLNGLPEAEAACAGRDLEFVRGVEVSSLTEHGEVHVLGLWLPTEPERLADLTRFLESMRQTRTERNLEIVEKLRSLGLDLTYADVLAEARGAVIGRPHLAMAMTRCGLTANPAEAFAKYLGRNGRAYVPRSLPRPQACVEILAAAGALPCLAHPCLSLSNGRQLESLIRELLPCGLRAVEAYHPEHRDADVRLCVDLAHKYGLALSGGSDYHGLAKPGIRLAVGRGGLRVPELIYRKLWLAAASLKEERHTMSHAGNDKS